MTKTIDLAVIPGDGIGPEVVDEALKVMETAFNRCIAINSDGMQLKVTEFDLGARNYQRTGKIITESDIEALREHDAILLGAIGDPTVPSGILERGLLLKLRFAFDHYVNLRPAKYYHGVPTPLANPGNIDFLVIREGTEGLYLGNGGTMREGTPYEIATELSINTAYGIERVVRFAFEKAEYSSRKRLTYVHKHNVLVNAGSLWRRIVKEVSIDYPSVNVDYLHIDAATIFLLTDPDRFDVIVTDNLFGDILTDEAGAITGGIGLAASGNINPEGNFPSMFEPVHGSAPDIAKQQKADPTAAIASAGLLLDHLGCRELARAIEAAIEADMAARAAAAFADSPSKRTTSEIGTDIAARL